MWSWCRCGHVLSRPVHPVNAYDYAPWHHLFWSHRESGQSDAILEYSAGIDSWIVDSLTLHVNTSTRIHLHIFGHKLLQQAHSLYVIYTLYTSIKVNKELEAISSLGFDKTIMQCLDTAVVYLLVHLCDMFSYYGINPLALELVIYSLAHHLCKMWIFYEPRRVTLGNTRHFVEE